MTAFVVGYGKIYHRSNAGVWSDHTPASVTSSNYRIMSVWSNGPTEAYAVGYLYYTNGPRYYKWDGSSWSTWNVTPNPGAYWRANHISAASRNEIYIVFYDITDSNIKVWKGDYTGNGSYILQINTSPYYANGCGYTAGENEFYLALRGSSAPTTYMKKWNGSSWSDSANLPAAVVHIHGSNGNIYTTYGSFTLSFNIYRGIWDSWNTDSSPANFFMRTYQNESDIWAYGNKCWIAGLYGTSSSKQAIAYYDGISWSTIIVNDRISNPSYFGIDGISDNNIIIANNRGYAYIFNGTIWTEESIGAVFDVQDLSLSKDVIVDSINPSIISQDGGVEIIVTGLFPTNKALEIYLGFNGSTSDPLCYGGQGYKTSPMSQDGETVKFYSPHYNPMERGELKLTIIYDDVPYVFGSLMTLIERSFKNKQLNIYSSFPPLMDTGKRLRDKERM